MHVPALIGFFIIIKIKPGLTGISFMWQINLHVSID
jgi:hypothetical protein